MNKHTLELDGLSIGDRVVVAMSGGVDSSATAALLVEAGYNVVGVTLQLYDHGAAIQKKGACCAGIDIYDARQVSEKLGIPHYVLDYETRFKSAVMEDFADSYLRGETPVPCIRCNQRVKFKDLLETARELGAKALVTGHYARREGGATGAQLHQAEDLSRDQSYFLFATTQDQLDYLRFPLANMPKTVTRAHAERLGLSIAKKPDSQDICFVPTGKYTQVIERLRPGSLEGGNIIHLDGRVLGTHSGIINYTIGQRRGLNIGGGEPLYVVALRHNTHEVVVGPKEALGVDVLNLKEVNWLASDRTCVDAYVRYRSSQNLVPAVIDYNPANKTAKVVFKAPEFGVSPGQACVVYEGTRVLGGGWIETTGDRAQTTFSLSSDNAGEAASPA